MAGNEVDKLGSLSQDALDRFIYLVGSARGGTTVLRNSMGIHDHILMLPGMTHFMNQVWRYRKKVHSRLLNQIFRMPPFYREKEVIRDLGGERGVELQRYISRAIASGNLRRMWQVYPLVYGLDAENSKRAGEIICWGDKSNDFYRLNDVERGFPKGKFVFLLRDPRGAVSSLARRAYQKETHVKGASVDDGKLVEASIHWRGLMQKMARFAGKHPDKTLMIKYEDFLAAPEASLNRIFRFVVDMPMDEGEIARRLRGLTYAATNDPETGTGISRKPLDRWKKVLSEPQVRVVAQITGETARKIGYDLEGSLFPGDFRGLVERLKTPKGRAAAFAKLCFLHGYERLI